MLYFQTSLLLLSPGEHCTHPLTIRTLLLYCSCCSCAHRGCAVILKYGGSESSYESATRPCAASRCFYCSRDYVVCSSRRPRSTEITAHTRAHEKYGVRGRNRREGFLNHCCCTVSASVERPRVGAMRHDNTASVDKTMDRKPWSLLSIVLLDSSWSEELPVVICKKSLIRRPRARSTNVGLALALWCTRGISACHAAYCNRSQPEKRTIPAKMAKLYKVQGSLLGFR